MVVARLRGGVEARPLLELAMDGSDAWGWQAGIEKRQQLTILCRSKNSLTTQMR